MPPLPDINYRKFVKKIKKAGFVYYRNAKGSHEIWFNPKNKRFVTIPKHAGRSFKKGTLSGMIKDIGVTVGEFNKL